MTPERVAQWKPYRLQVVERRRHDDLGVALRQVVDDLGELLLAHRVVDERVVLGQQLVEERAAQGGLQTEAVARLELLLALLGDRRHPAARRDGAHREADVDGRLQRELAVVERHRRLGRGAERAALALGVAELTVGGQEEQTEDHVLGRHRDRTAVEPA